MLSVQLTAVLPSQPSNIDPDMLYGLQQHDTQPELDFPLSLEVNRAIISLEIKKPFGAYELLAIFRDATIFWPFTTSYHIISTNETRPRMSTSTSTVSCLPMA